jgi:hypothetical protein
MTTVSPTDLAAILLGTEHGGDSSTIYGASFTVPNSILGSSISGLSKHWGIMPL